LLILAAAVSAAAAATTVVGVASQLDNPAGPTGERMFPGDY